MKIILNEIIRRHYQENILTYIENINLFVVKLPESDRLGDLSEKDEPPYLILTK